VHTEFNDTAQPGNSVVGWINYAERARPYHFPTDTESSIAESRSPNVGDLVHLSFTYLIIFVTIEQLKADRSNYN